MIKSIKEIKAEVFENIEVENVKHDMMIKHLKKEADIQTDKEQKAKFLLKVAQIKESIESNKRFIKNNE